MRRIVTDGNVIINIPDVMDYGTVPMEKMRHDAFIPFAMD